MQRAARRADEDERRARKWQQQQQRREQQDRGLGQAAVDAHLQTGPRFGNGMVGGNDNWTAPVYGTTADGQPVTASFGRAGGRTSGETFLRDGHAEQYADFFGPNGQEQHDHYGSGNGPNNNGTERGKYTGYGS